MKVQIIEKANERRKKKFFEVNAPYKNTHKNDEMCAVHYYNRKLLGISTTITTYTLYTPKVESERNKNVLASSVVVVDVDFGDFFWFGIQHYFIILSSSK